LPHTFAEHVIDDAIASLTFPNTDAGARAEHEPTLHRLYALREASLAAAAAAGSQTPLMPPPEQLQGTILALYAAASDLTQLRQPICPRCCAEASRKAQARIGALTEEHAALHRLLTQLQARRAAAEATAAEEEARLAAAAAALEALAGSQQSNNTNSTSADVGVTVSAAEAEAAVAASEAALEADAAAALLERAALAAESAALAQELTALTAADKAVLRGHQSLQTLKADFEEALYAAEEDSEKLAYDLTQLMLASPLQDLFPIAVDGHIAVISSFRLGRLPTVPVEWAEVNQALGQVALMVEVLRKLTGTALPGGMKLVPKGPQSGIVRGADQVLLPLWRSESGLANALFRATGFSDALTALLACVGALGQRAAAGDDTLARMLYPIDAEAGTIGGVSVRYQGSQQEGEWTRALKYLLINCQVALSGARPAQ